MEGQRVEIPTPAEKLKFNHHFKKLRHPCDFCADFESLTTTTKKYLYRPTYNYQEHKPCGFMLHSVNAVDNAKHDFFCKGELMLSVFSAINIFSEIRDGTKERMQGKREIDMTDEDREDFKDATRCFMWR